MPLIDLLRGRRSVRRYRPQAVPPEAIETLIEAMLRSPSSRDLRPWRFILVQDGPTLEALSRCKEHGASFLAKAPLGIVFCADETLSDAWVEDCAVATTIAHLTAESLGLGSCWIQVRMRSTEAGKPAEQVVREILGLPQNMRVLSILAVGLPAKKAPGHDASTLARDRVKRSP